MAFEFHCWNCGRKMRISEQQHSTQVECPVCLRLNHAPGIEAESNKLVQTAVFENPNNPYAAPQASFVFEPNTNRNTSIKRDDDTDRVRSYLTQAVLVTIFFCYFPLGIVAIVHASQVEVRELSGDREGAKRSSMLAKYWSWIAFWVGVSLLVLYLVSRA